LRKDISSKEIVKNQALISLFLNQCLHDLSTMDNKITKKLTALAAILTSLSKWVETNVIMINEIHAAHVLEKKPVSLIYTSKPQ
jgi:hypothetical protein